MHIIWPGHQNDLPCGTCHVPHNSCYLLRFAKGVRKVLIKSATYFSATTMAAFAPLLRFQRESPSVWAIGSSHWNQYNVCARSRIQKFSTVVLFYFLNSCTKLLAQNLELGTSATAVCVLLFSAYALLSCVFL